MSNQTYVIFVAANQNISIVHYDILQVRLAFISALAKLASSNDILRLDDDVAVCGKSQLMAFQF